MDSALSCAGWRLSSSAVWLLGSLATLPVEAAPPLPLASIAHTISLGDTLEHLAAQYLGDARRWPTLQQANQVKDPRRLLPGTVLQIPVHLLPSTTATVTFSQGTVQRLTTRPLRESPTATSSGTHENVLPGDTLTEGTRLQTGAGAYVTVRLADGTTVRVHSNTDLTLQQLRRRGRLGSLQSVLEMHGGALETSAPPATQPSPTPQRRLDIETPVATASVRGTHFDVRVHPGGQFFTAVQQGQVAVRGKHSSHTPPAATLLEVAQGIAVDAQGQVGEVQPLLPAPDVQSLPGSAHDASLLTLPLPPLGHASAWEVSVARDAEFTQILRHAHVQTTWVEWPPVDDGMYHLRLRGIDAYGIPGMASQRPLHIKTQPVPPLAQSPSTGGTLALGEAQLRCTDVPGASHYAFEIARDEAFRQPVHHAQVAECSLFLKELPTGRYHWRVASVRTTQDSQDQGPYSPAQAFAVEHAPATVMQLDAQDNAPQVTLHWSAQAGQRFRLQLLPDEQGSKILDEQELQHPTWTSPPLAAGRYYVRLQVLSASGLRSAFSAPRAIQVAASVLDGSGQPLRTHTGASVQSP